jgi:hypothetical protein
MKTNGELIDWLRSYFYCLAFDEPIKTSSVLPQDTPCKFTLIYAYTMLKKSELLHISQDLFFIYANIL